MKEISEMTPEEAQEQLKIMLAKYNQDVEETKKFYSKASHYGEAAQKKNSLRSTIVAESTGNTLASEGEKEEATTSPDIPQEAETMAVQEPEVTAVQEPEVMAVQENVTEKPVFVEKIEQVPSKQYHERSNSKRKVQTNNTNPIDQMKNMIQEKFDQVQQIVNEKKTEAQDKALAKWEEIKQQIFDLIEYYKKIMFEQIELAKQYAWDKVEEYKQLLLVKKAEVEVKIQNVLGAKSIKTD